MANPQVGITFRLARTDKLWGTVFYLEKQKCAQFIMSLKKFLYRYFIRIFHYVVYFYLYFVRFSALLDLVLFADLNNRYPISRQIWRPSEPTNVMSRKFWHLKWRKPYSVFARERFMLYHRGVYQPLLTRRKQMLRYVKRIKRKLKGASLWWVRRRLLRRRLLKRRMTPHTHYLLSKYLTKTKTTNKVFRLSQIIRLHYLNTINRRMFSAIRGFRSFLFFTESEFTGSCFPAVHRALRITKKCFRRSKAVLSLNLAVRAQRNTNFIKLIKI